MGHIPDVIIVWVAVYLVRMGDLPHSRQAVFELDVIIPQNGHIRNPLVAGAVSLRTLQ
jgi:hypothetical protein